MMDPKVFFTEKYWKRLCAFFQLLCMWVISSDSLASDKTDDLANKAKKLVQEALSSEASGGNASRSELLIQAKEIAPDEPTVRWQQGQIQSGRTWLSYPELVARTKNSKVLEDYRTLRDKSKPTLESQYELIQYCKKHGLKDQATSHWSAIAELAPDNAEARSQLGFERVDGRWVDRRELELEREKAKRVAEILLKKGPDLRQLASDLAANKIDEPQAIQQLAKDLDVDSIPVWELCLSSANHQGAAAVVGALMQSNAPESTKSLARHAVLGYRSRGSKYRNEITSNQRCLRVCSSHVVGTTRAMDCQSPMDVRRKQPSLLSLFHHLRRQGFASLTSTGRHLFSHGKRVGSSDNGRPCFVHVAKPTRIFSQECECPDRSSQRTDHKRTA
jgi:hypothetical protein